MREHQIVITLKPEQFLEVQRLARAANAKSMGIFVRQKLLAALGIQGSLEAEQQQSRADLEPVVGQMKRLHSELKMFVAESLSIYNQEFDVSVVVEQPLAIEQITPLESTATADELERVAERTFAISPRLGAIAPADEELVRLREAVPPGLLNHKTNELYGRHELHRRETHRYLHQRAVNEVLDTPFAGEDATFELEPGLAIRPSDSGGEPTVSGLDVYYDEHSSPKPVVRDPLEQLLPDDQHQKSNKSKRALAEQQSMEADDDLDDDDLFDVPLSIAERRRQLADELEQGHDDDAHSAADFAHADPDFEQAGRQAGSVHEDDLHVDDEHAGVQATEVANELSAASRGDIDKASSATIANDDDRSSVSDVIHEPDAELYVRRIMTDSSATAAGSEPSLLPSGKAANESISASSAAANVSSDKDLDEEELRPSRGTPLGYPPLSGSPPPKRRQV